MFEAYEHITDYLEGRLSPDKIGWFEEKMERDPELKKIVNDPKVYATIADNMIDHSLSQKIKEEQANLTNKRRKIPVHFYFIAALALILLIALPVLFSKSTGQELFDAYYSPPMLNAIRGGHSDNTPDIKGCDQGHVYLEQKNYSKAKESFILSMESNETRCQSKAMFYTALIAVREENYEEAKKYLEILNQKSNSGYDKKATELLEIIK